VATGAAVGAKDAAANRVLDVTGQVVPEPRVHYLIHDFELPRAATSLPGHRSTAWHC